jgi:hypothetical protein
MDFLKPDQYISGIHKKNYLKGLPSFRKKRKDV